MPKNLWIKRFNPDDDFVWRRVSSQYAPGEDVVKKNFTPRRLKQLYESRYIVERDTWNQFVGVSSSAPDKARVVVDSAPVSDAGDPLDTLRADAKIEKAAKPAPALPGMTDGAA